MYYEETKKKERKVLFLDFDGIKDDKNAENDTVRDILHKIIYESCGFRHDLEIVFCSPFRGIADIEGLKELFNTKFYTKEAEMLPKVNGESTAEGIEKYLSSDEDLRKYLVVSTENLLARFPGHFVHIRDGILTEKLVSQISRVFDYGFWWERGWHFSREPIDDGFKNVIFLDIDGVLNKEDENTDNGEYIIEEYVANLAEIVASCNAEIVLTSSWRAGLGGWIYGSCKEDDYNFKRYKMLSDLFQKYDLRISGATPDLSSGAKGRPFEVRAWLAERMGVEHFVILDDDDFWQWDWLSPFFVCTKDRIEGQKFGEYGTTIFAKSRRGLTRDKLEKAMVVLNSEIRLCN